MRAAWVAAFLLTACATAPAPPPFASRFEPAACASEHATAEVRCGRIVVPENYAAPDGRTIALNVAIVSAAEPRAGSAPLYFIDGGPGDPATRRIRYYLNEGRGYRRHREVVMFDQRGTGLSHPLHCPEITFAPDPNDAMYPEGSVARCREMLAADADLSQFNTTNSARDLDVVRAALGHETIDLYAGSYGTMLSMAYMGLAPRRVRAAVLVGAAPWFAMPPRFHALAAHRSLLLAFAACKEDPGCNAAFPDLEGDLARARARAPQSEEAPLRDMFMEDLRRIMYRAEGVRRVPMLVHRVAENGLPPVDTPPPAPLPQPGPLDFADGLYLSITCAEALSRMPFGEASRAARATAFNDYRLHQQSAACADWQVARATDTPPDLTRVRAPVLLISGQFDPVTPPEWATWVSRRLPNARQVMLAEGSHINNGLSHVDTCLDPLLQRFYETMELATLDVSCVETMRAPAWVLE
jgi:pimeloyl-ACP methyl ester carboxylesterase